jgi:hypothetical protein
MNPGILLTVPYKLYRVPLAVLDHHVAQRLRVDSPPRLAFDRALGSYDRMDGRLLNNDDIAEQGRERIARSGKLAGAVALERDAAARREQAAKAAVSGHRSATAKRQQARRRLADGLDAADAAERQGKQRAATRARAQAKDKKQRADAVTKRRVNSIHDGLKQVDAATEAKLRQTRRGAKAKLDDAATTKAAANSARANADQLGQLATSKRNSRKR